MIAAIPYRGMVSKGRFVPDDPKGFKAAFYHNEGKQIVVTVKRWRPQRTNPQNKWYWSVIVGMIADYMGEDDPEVVHNLLRQKFLYRIVEIGGEKEKALISTPTLTTAEFSEYCEKIRRWSAQFLSLYIPDPGEMEI